MNEIIYKEFDAWIKAVQQEIKKHEEVYWFIDDGTGVLKSQRGDIFVTKEKHPKRFSRDNMIACWKLQDFMGFIVEENNGNDTK